VSVRKSVGVEVEVVSEELNTLISKEVVVISPVVLLGQITPKFGNKRI
jgi:hypothetical protein